MTKFLVLSVALSLLGVACGGSTDEPVASDASEVVVADAATPDEAKPEAASEDPYPYAYACCHFANEGLTEYDGCCAKWRAEHGGKDSL